MPATIVSREHWTGLGFMLAAIGSAVGLGNIWRFPYMVGISGGGAFLIPYIIGVLFFAIPLMILELDVGRKFQGSVLTSLKKINSKIWYVGIIPVIVSMTVLSYYLVITGWTLAYFFFSFSGYMQFLQFKTSILPLLFFFASLAIVAFIVSKGIRKGIEKTSKIVMPMFFILLVALALYSLSLPGAEEGLAFYLVPDFSQLLNLDTWIRGFSQAFFSVSVGYGILITYASYLGKKGSVAKPVIGIATADALVALVGGLIVFPIVFTFGISPAMGADLTFVSLPLVFQSITLGFFVGFMFFALLFIAALTSAVSMLEVGVSTLVDEIKWSRKKSVIAMSLVTLLVGVPSALSYYGATISLFGIPFLDFMDLALGTTLLLSASLLCIAIIWFYEPKIFYIPIKHFYRIGLSKTMKFLLKYAIPIILLLMFILQLAG
ncbi:MAG: sodium-dependent transporter [Nanoarchaeota archaeon]